MKKREIILTGKILDGLLDAAQRDGILSGNHRPYLRSRPPTSACRARALELLVLFDELHLRGCPPRVDFEKLSGLGQITAEAFGPPSQTIDLVEGYKWWGREEVFGTNKNFLRSLYHVKSLVIEQLMYATAKNHDIYELRERIKVSDRVFWSTIFELIGQKYLSLSRDEDKEMFKGTYTQHLRGKVGSYYRALHEEGLVGRFMMDGSYLAHVHVLAEGESMLKVLEEGSQRGCMVASGHYLHSDLNYKKAGANPKHVHDTLKIVRSSMKSEGLNFPVIHTLSGAMRLRDDPRVRDFRETLMSFVEVLETGDVRAASNIISEVQKANQALKSVGPFRRVGEIATWLSVPFAVVDLLLTAGIGGLVCTAVSVGSMIVTKQVEKKHRWIHFGQN